MSSTQNKGKQLFLVLFSLITALFYSSVFAASDKTLSENYSSINVCTEKLESYNVQYPKFKRTACFENASGTFNYYLCSEDTGCDLSDAEKKSVSVVNNTSVKSSTASSDTTVGVTAITKISDKHLKLLDRVIGALEKKKAGLSGAEYNKMLDKFSSRLDKLKRKYNNNQKIGNLVDYLSTETKKLYIDTEMDDFFCELTGSCNKTEVGKNEINTSGGGSSGTTITKPIEISKENPEPMSPEEPIDIQANKGETCESWLTRIGKNGATYGAELVYGDEKVGTKNIVNRCAYMMWQPTILGQTDSDNGKYICTTASRTFTDSFAPKHPAYPVVSCDNGFYVASTVVDDRKLDFDDTGNGGGGVGPEKTGNTIELEVKGPYISTYAGTKDATHASLYQKIEVLWNIGENTNCSFIDRKGENYDFGKKYDVNGSISSAGSIGSTKGGFKFLINRAGPIKIKCNNNSAEYNIEFLGGQRAQYYESDQDWKYIADRGRLIDVKAEIINGDIMGLTWEIHSNIDLKTCKALGFNTGELNHNGSVKFLLAGLRSTQYYKIVCDDPRSVSNEKLTALGYDSISYRLPTRGVGMSSDKKEIKKGEKVKLSWNFDGHHNVMIIDMNGYNSIEGKSYKYLINRDQNFIYQGGRINDGQKGSVYVTPYYSTSYMIIGTDGASSQSRDSRFPKFSILDIKVDGKEVVRTDKLKDDIKLKYLDSYRPNNVGIYNGVQVEGVCGASGYNMSKNFIDDFSCKVGEMKNYKIDKNWKEGWWSYSRTCEGSGGGVTRTCSAQVRQ